MLNRQLGKSLEILPRNTMDSVDLVFFGEEPFLCSYSHTHRLLFPPTHRFGQRHPAPDSGGKRLLTGLRSTFAERRRLHSNASTVAAGLLAAPASRAKQGRRTRRSEAEAEPGSGAVGHKGLLLEAGATEPLERPEKGLYRTRVFKVVGAHGVPVSR